jgi:hypothetical protein
MGITINKNSRGKIVFLGVNFLINLGEVKCGTVFAERRVLLVLIVIYAEVAQLVVRQLADPRQKL